MYILSSKHLTEAKTVFLAIIDISHQIGQFQVFTAYNSPSCVFKPKSPFDVEFD